MGGKGKGGGGGGKGGMPPQMFGGVPGQGFGQGMMPPTMGMMGMQGMQGMQGTMRPQMMGMMPQQMGKGCPQMMGMMGKGGPMMGSQMAGGKGGAMMMRPQMQQNMQTGMRPNVQMGQPQGPGGMCGAAPSAGGPLSASALAAAPPSVQKKMIGEKLYPAIMKYQPELAGKITGMMLEMDNSELLMLLESEQQLRNKVVDALRVLEGGGK